MRRADDRPRYFTLAAFLWIAGCVTVNVYFPAAQVEKTAEEIVEDVYRKENGLPLPEGKDQPRSLLERGILEGLSRALVPGPAAAYAEEATTVSNATIRALKGQITQRHQQLLPYYRGGQVGITREGFLEIRSTEGLDLSRVAALKRLVEADNASRRQLYQEVAKALNVSADQVPRVREIFARQWRDKAEPGWEVQSDDGRWGKK